MNKNLFLRLCLMIGLFTILFSCRSEILQTNEEANIQSQNFVLRRLNFQQLKEQNPALVEKLKNLKKNASSGNSLPSSSSKIYTDAENGFYIDADEIYFVEDREGNKTYTFKIERPEATENKFLENLVLKDLGENNLFAYLVKYDSISQHANRDMSYEELQGHIFVSSLGATTQSEIFGLMSPCPPIYSTIGTWVFVPGHKCVEGLHDYGQGCAYLGTSDAATQDHYEIVYSVMVTEGMGGCGPGGSGNFGTTPHTGGGSGSTSTNDPCAKLAAMLNKNIPSNNPPGPISEIPTYLQSHLNAPTTGAKELAINVYYPFSSTDPIMAFKESSAQDGSLQATMTIPTGSKTIFFGHDHTNGENVLSIFSLKDLYSILIMLNNGNADSNTYFYITTKFGTKYYLRFANDDFKNWMNQYNFFLGWDMIFPQGVTNQFVENSEEKYKDYVKYDKTNEENLKGFYEFFNDRDILGMDMLEVLPNGDTYKLMYINGTLTKTKCQ